jgi:hypothetical protein
LYGQDGIDVVEDEVTEYAEDAEWYWNFWWYII